MLGKIEASLNERLNSVQWGEYTIGDLFERVTSKPLKYKVSELPKSPTGDYTLPALTAGVENQGLNCYIPYGDVDVLKEVISISANGANTGATFYQKNEFVVLQDAYAIKWKKSSEKLTDNQYLFLVVSIRNTIWGAYEWTNKAGWNRVKEDKIKLPIKNNKIDFDFMESFVAELEAQRVVKLEAYLTVTGLKDYQLTVEEAQAIKNHSQVVWEEFKMSDIFERIRTKKLPYKAKELPGEPIGDYILPCLTSSFMNQGLNYYAPIEDTTVLKNVISIPSNSDVYRAYFQSREFTVLSDAYAIRWIYEDREITNDQYLFAVQCINKITDLPIYSYKNKLGGWNKVKDKYIKLPVKDGKVDYDYMDIFIRAIKKLVIKDVVIWADKKIEATKQVIEK